MPGTDLWNPLWFDMAKGEKVSFAKIMVHIPSKHLDAAVGTLRHG